MKLSTLSRTAILTFILLPIFIGCSSSKEKKVVIVFEKPPTLKQEHELISNLPNHLLNENLSESIEGKPRLRPAQTLGQTRRIKTGEGTLYITKTKMSKAFVRFLQLLEKLVVMQQLNPKQSAGLFH